MLHWFCEVIEVRAAYLVDDILSKNKGMKVTQARDIAIERLCKNPVGHVKPPYIKIDDYDGRSILFPWWFLNRYSQQELYIDDEIPYGNGISDVLGRLNEFGGWEDAKDKF